MFCFCAWNQAIKFKYITYTVSHAHAHDSRHESKNDAERKAVFPIRGGKMLPSVT